MARPAAPLALEDDLRAISEIQAQLNQAITRLAAHVEAERTRGGGTGPRLMTVKQVMAETTLSRSRIQALRRDGRLPFHRIDGRIVLAREAFETFLEEIAS